MGYMVSFGRIRLWQVTLFCTVVFAAGLVIPTLTTAQSSSKEDTYRQLGLFGDIFQRVRESYCLLYTSPSPRDREKSRMPSSA